MLLSFAYPDFSHFLIFIDSLTKLQIQLLQWSILGVMVALIQASILYSVSLSKYKGYYWRSLIWDWRYFIGSLFVQWFITLSIFELNLTVFDLGRPLSVLVAGGLAIIIVVLPELASDYILEVMSGGNPDTKWSRILRQMKLDLKLRFRMAARTCQEQDNFDLLTRETGNWGVTKKDAWRRIRMVYEVYKLQIATERRNPRLLRFDTNIYPGLKYYPLAEFLGKRKLKKFVKKPPKMASGWNGSERRREAQAEYPFRRIYDFPDIRKMVERGEKPAQILKRLASLRSENNK